MKPDPFIYLTVEEQEHIVIDLMSDALEAPKDSDFETLLPELITIYLLKKFKPEFRARFTPLDITGDHNERLYRRIYKTINDFLDKGFAFEVILSYISNNLKN